MLGAPFSPPSNYCRRCKQHTKPREACGCLSTLHQWWHSHQKISLLCWRQTFLEKFLNTGAVGISGKRLCLSAFPAWLSPSMVPLGAISESNYRLWSLFSLVFSSRSAFTHRCFVFSTSGCRDSTVSAASPSLSFRRRCLSFFSPPPVLTNYCEAKRLGRDLWPQFSPAH